MKNQTNKPLNVIQNAIAANLEALSQRLTEAAELAGQACEAMTAGQQNQAMGTVLDFDRLLGEATALFNAAKALHKGA